MDKELTGKTALITGASRGIGAATAIALARHGVSRFLLHYNSNPEGMERTLAAVRETGAAADSLQGNLAESSGIHEFVDNLKRTRLEPDIVVNNAGSLVQRAKLLEYTDELFDRVMNLNVKSAWFIAQAMAPAMLTRGSGVIVNVSSIAARNGGGPGATIYAAAKASISTITFWPALPANFVSTTVLPVTLPCRAIGNVSAVAVNGFCGSRSTVTTIGALMPPSVARRR